MRKCPYCAEEIQDTAIKCMHCGADSINWRTKSWETWNKYWVYIICIPIIIIAAGFLFISQKANLNKNEVQVAEINPPKVEAPVVPIAAGTAAVTPEKKKSLFERYGTPEAALAAMPEDQFKKFVATYGNKYGVSYVENKNAKNADERFIRVIPRISEGEGPQQNGQGGQGMGIDITKVPLKYLPSIMRAMAGMPPEGRIRSGQPKYTSTPSYSIPNYDNTYTAPSHSHRQSEDEYKYEDTYPNLHPAPPSPNGDVNGDRRAIHNPDGSYSYDNGYGAIRHPDGSHSYDNGYGAIHNPDGSYSYGNRAIRHPDGSYSYGN